MHDISTKVSNVIKKISDIVFCHYLFLFVFVFVFFCFFRVFLFCFVLFLFFRLAPEILAHTKCI